MVNLTLSIPVEVKQLMDEYQEIRWSEVVRKAIVQKLAVLRKLDQLSETSKLNDKDIEKIEHEIKRSIAKKHGV